MSPLTPRRLLTTVTPPSSLSLPIVDDETYCLLVVVAQMLSAVGAGGASAARCAREHPRAAVAATAGAATALWVGKETRRSGLLVYSSPRISLFRVRVYVMCVAAEGAHAPPTRGAFCVNFV